MLNLLHKKWCYESADTCKTRTVQVSHLASPVVRFLMCLRIKSRSPPTGKFSEEGSEMHNQEKDNEVSKPTENLEHPAATSVSIVERHTAVIETHTHTHNEMGTSLGLPEIPEIRGRKSEIFKLWKTRTEKTRSEFVFRNCRLVNRLDNYIDFMNPQGLKTRLLKLIWKFVNEIYSELNVCAWQLYCDCSTCHNKRTLI